MQADVRRRSSQRLGKALMEQQRQEEAALLLQAAGRHAIARRKHQKRLAAVGIQAAIRRTLAGSFRPHTLVA